jgi:predicted GNAT family acetyltransferase
MTRVASCYLSQATPAELKAPNSGVPSDFFCAVNPEQHLSHLELVIMSTNVLDNPIWHALSSEHACFALGDGVAKRYPAEVSPLAGLREPSRESYNVLAELMTSQEIAILFLDESPHPPESLRVLQTFAMEQMVCTAPQKLSGHNSLDSGLEMRALQVEDVPQMQALVQLTEPGPFRRRTIEFGGYLGVFEGSRLAAMTGQRCSLTGHTEVSAVCTHPEYRGRGLGATLVAEVTRTLIARGITPYLGVRQTNAVAIRLYERLGFTVRRTLQVGVVQRQP